MKTILIIEDEERSREALIRKIRQYLGMVLKWMWRETD